MLPRATWNGVWVRTLKPVSGEPGFLGTASFSCSPPEELPLPAGKFLETELSGTIHLKTEPSASGHFLGVLKRLHYYVLTRA